MGVCCTKSAKTSKSTDQTKYSKDTKENKSTAENKVTITKTEPVFQNLTTNNQNDNVVGKTKQLPITLDQVNKSIDEWKQVTKRRKPNTKPTLSEENNLFMEPEDEIKNCLDELKIVVIDANRNNKINGNLSNNYENLGIDNSNNEINQDFLNIKQKINQCFSEISSTLHFTALNSKDLVSSKLNKLQTQGHNSQSIVNFLEELNNHNLGYIRHRDSNININININLNNNINSQSNHPGNNLKSERDKIFIQNNNLFITKNEIKEISLTVSEKSKITIKKSRNTNNFNYSSTQNLNNMQINSYFIANRTPDHQINTIEEDMSKNNNDATIHSASIHSNLEFYQENVYYQIEKINFNKEGVNYASNSNLFKLSSELLLKDNCHFNGMILPPWEKEICEKKGNKITNQTINYLEEIDGLKVEWKKCLNSNSCSNFCQNINPSDLKNLKQGASNNCSVIAAVISISNYDKKFEKKILNSIVYPSSSGMMSVKLYINGCSRFLQIDDYLPFNKLTQKIIFSDSKSNDYFVNFIEKAIYILYNGYSNNNTNSMAVNTFSIKSNPSYEIYHLTGWIPEIVLFNDISNKDNLWQRLYSNFTEGNIMVCIGTGTIKDPCKNNLGIIISTSTNLIQDHSYAVVDVLELTDRKLMKCKNPWGHTIPSISFNIRNVKKIRNDKEEKQILKDQENGFFWIDWNYVLDCFSYIFLAWNPNIYPSKYSFVSSWQNDKTNSKFYDENYSLENNPQYLITIPEHKEDFEVRILITKLIKNLDNSPRPRKTISFKLFWYEGYPIVYPIEHLRSLQNPFREVNSDVFIFEASNQVEQYVLVILKNEDNDENSEETAFALDIFSFVEIEVNPIPKREIKTSKKFIDNWISAGGNFTSPNFVNNPQYKLELQVQTHLQIKLETALTTPVMVSVIENGNHASKIPYDYIISNKNPGFYYNSFSYFECFLVAGEYNITCVSQEEKNVGKYCLEVNTIHNDKTTNKPNSPRMNAIKIEKINFIQNFQFLELLKGSWENNSPGIVSNTNAMIKNPGFIFYPTQKTKIKFILRSLFLKKKVKDSMGLSDFPSLTVFLYRIDSSPNSENKFTIIMDGTSKICSAFGFFSHEIEIDVNQYGYMVLCVNLNKSQFSKFEFEIHSNYRLDSISSNANFRYKKRNFNIYGKWDKLNSGGGLNLTTFHKNPIYEIQATKNTEALIELSANDDYLISFLITENKNDNNFLQSHQIDKESFPELNQQINYQNYIYSKKFIFELGKKYLLIPFTNLANKVFNF